MSASVSGGGGLEASLAHHVVRLCWAAMGDCHFQMIIRPPGQKSRFLTPSCVPVTLRFIFSQMLAYAAVAFIFAVVIIVILQWG